MISIYTFHTANCLVLLITFYGVSCNFNLNEEEWVLLTKPQQYRTPSQRSLLTSTPIPSSVTSLYDDISNVKFGKLFTADPYLYEHVESSTDNDKTRYLKDFTTKLMSNEVVNRSADGIQCLRCFTDRGFMSDESCYNGKTQTHLKCLATEVCYTELHPQYIKRGCFMPNKMNRTFVCNCPLCNDKPAYEPVYYQYKKIGDWDYHNKRVQIPIVGMQLICKVCDTRGINKIADDNCRFGKNADYVVCGRNQVCYINYDEDSDFVSRGCTDTPAYNSMFYFCNNSLCNSKPFYIPKIRSEKLLLNDLSPKPSTISRNSVMSIKFINIFNILAIITAGFAVTDLDFS